MKVQTPEPNVPEFYYAPFVDSTPLISDPVALRQRGEEDGYLFFRQLLPKEPLWELRRQFLAIAEEQGWVIPGTDGRCNLDAVNRLTKDDLAFHIPNPVYAKVQQLELFHRLPHLPKLLAVYDAIFGEPVLPHPRCIGRIILPHRDAVPTPTHQDYIHIQGTRKFWTCWFPLGDCPVDLGGLMVLKGSHQGGVRFSHKVVGAGGIAVDICDSEKDSWVGGNYESGDVLTFPSMTVHRAFPNQHPDMVRLSCDNRYQAVSEPVEIGSLIPHGRVTTWEEIYRGWKNDDLKYYWEKMPLVDSPWDENLRWQKEHICT